MQVKVIAKDIIEINPGEVVEEVTVLERFLFWDITRVYRKVHGQWFNYKNKRYTRIHWSSCVDAESYLYLPIEE
tara:strand:+ start:545 stop:766 length:222 start_codon:yes stop_codon:yes gene_type:complete